MACLALNTRRMAQLLAVSMLCNLGLLIFAYLVVEDILFLDPMDGVSSNNMQQLKTTGSQKRLLDKQFVEEKPEKGEYTNQLEESCDPMPKALPVRKRSNNKPVWVPGFPGSGSEMLRQLITMTTGQITGNIHGNLCGEKYPVITCKTHWPLFGDGPAKFDRFAEDFVLLVRNPAHAIPSYFSWIWENGHKVKTHTKQAPEAEWQDWRNRVFDEHLVLWKRVILDWNSQEQHHMALVLPFEDLVNKETGPDLLTNLISQLKKSYQGQLKTAALDKIPCLWKKGTGSHSHQRNTHAYQSGFTAAEKEAMLNAVEEIAQKVPAMKEIMERYREEIQQNTRVQDANYHAPLPKALPT